MFDPTQTQPLSWRMHQGKAMPWEDVPVDPKNRQAPTFDDSPPERLSERGYRLRARLGGGRLGAIYEAQDELSRNSGSQHFVAILLIDSRIASRAGFDADFERGAAELKSVSHPNIVKLLEYGRDQNRFYLVNEMLESASLRFVLNDVSTLPAAETTAVLRAVGDALQYLHAKNMVHGNLRPENVLVTFGYEVKLLDVVPNGWLVNPNDALGVPARAPDKRDDVFGLACLGYEMLAGRHPFNGNTAQEAYRAGMEAERIDRLGDREWRALAGALAVHRDDRTPSVAQFLDEFGAGTGQRLKSVVATGNAPAAPVPDMPRPTYSAPEPPPALTRPVVAERAMRGRPERRGVFGTLFLLIVLAGLGYAVWYYQEPLRAFSTDLIAEVDTRIAAERARPAPAPTAGSADAPLEQAAPVSDPEPAMVLAPGASVPADATPPVAGGDEPVVSPPQSPAATQAKPAAPPVQQQAAPPPAVVEPAPGVVEEAPAPAASAQAMPVPAPSVPVAASGPTRFSFAQDRVTVREGDVAARITIRRSGNLSGTASVSWWTEQESARADEDYADLGARIERFAPGEASRTVYVPLINDGAREPVKSFRVMIGGSEGAGDAAVRVDIIDDD